MNKVQGPEINPPPLPAKEDMGGGYFRYVPEESKKSLIETNPFLKDPETRKEIIETVTVSSAAVEGTKKSAEKAIEKVKFGEARKQLQKKAALANLAKAHEVQRAKKAEREAKTLVLKEEAAALDKTLSKTSMPDVVRKEIIDVFYETGGKEGLLRWINNNKKKGLQFYYKELLMPVLKMASDSDKPMGPRVIVNITGLHPEKTMVNVTPAEG